MAALTRAYDANPGEVQSMFALVRSYVLAKQLEKADAFLDLVLSRNTSNAEAHVLKGLLQTANNQVDAAAESFKAAIEASPKNPVGYRALSDLRIRQKRYDDALGVLRDGLREQPADSPLLLAYAEVLELNGDIGAAITTYEGLLKNEPGSLIVRQQSRQPAGGAPRRPSEPRSGGGPRQEP